MSSTDLLAFVVVNTLLVLTPGADWAYVIAVGVRRGPIGAAVGGLLAGYLVVAIVVVLGAGALVAESDAALRVLTLVGALYLLWLGVSVLRAPVAPTDAGAQPAAGWPVARRAAFISGANPKGLLLYFAVLPQFVDPAAGWSVVAQLALLAAIHMTTCGVVYLGVGTGSRALLAARPTAARRVVRGSGAAMCVIAALLLAEAVLA